MMKQLIILLLTGFLFIQCQSARIEQNNNDSILGKWEWVKTQFERRGSGTTVVDPASSGQNLTAEFLSDQKLIITITGAQPIEATYTLEQPANTDYPLLKITFPPDVNGRPVEQGPYRIENNELYIMGGYNDAGGNQYFRRK